MEQIDQAADLCQNTGEGGEGSVVNLDLLGLTPQRQKHLPPGQSHYWLSFDERIENGFFERVKPVELTLGLKCLEQVN